MIVWIDGTFGIGKTTSALEVCNILGKNKCVFYDPDIDFKEFLKKR